MADEVIVVEAKVTVGLIVRPGVIVDSSGVFAVERSRIAATLQHLPTLVKVLDQVPTEEMIQRATARGLIAEPEKVEAPAATAAAIDDMTRAELALALEALGLATGGNRATLAKRLRAADPSITTDADEDGDG